jgi:predicted nucleotidyltransferase
MSTDEIIDEMVERIVTCVHPAQVILFGSQARGSAHPDSDVDLLVVMDTNDTDRKHLTVTLRAVVADLPLPKDILISTPQEIATRGQLQSTPLYAALHEGIVLYAR